ncbi:MAG: proline iminopeptidase-family hydrolase [Gemmatimonadota bacterium]
MPRLTLAMATLVLTTGCADSPTTRLVPGEGYIHFKEGRMWYQVVGSGPGTPVIMLHGGPGFSAHYLTPLTALGNERPVVIYDQLGSGRSDATTDLTLWTEAAFVAQLEALRDSLGIEKFHLLGHSWGTMLGVQYYFAHPDRVASLVLSSPALSIPDWLADGRALLATLPDSVQQAVAKYEASADYANPEYQAAVMAFYHQFVSRAEPWSVYTDSAFAAYNPKIYGYMWGPSEFTATGPLQGFDVTDSLPLIQVPTLFLAGEFDEAVPATVQRHAALVPGAEFAVIPGSAHMTPTDNTAEHLRMVREFYRRVEKR